MTRGMGRWKMTHAAPIVPLLEPAAARARSPPVTEVPLGAPVTQLTAGPGGAVWAVGPGNPGRVASLLPDATVREFVGGATPGFGGDRQPSEIALGPDGNLWIAERNGSASLLRLTPDGDANEFS